MTIFGPKPLVNPFGKMSIIRLFFGQKPWINPFVKMSIFRFFLTSCFYSLEGRSFVLEYSERHFPCLYCVKKTFWNNGHFWTKPLVNPFVKMSTFMTFWIFCFYSLERSIFVVKYRKKHFPGLYCLKKEVW